MRHPKRSTSQDLLVGSYHVVYNQRVADQLLRAGVEVGVLWRDGRQFNIPYGIRLALGLPSRKREEALRRLRDYVL